MKTSQTILETVFLFVELFVSEFCIFVSDCVEPSVMCQWLKYEDVEDKKLFMENLIQPHLIRYAGEFISFVNVC